MAPSVVFNSQLIAKAYGKQMKYKQKKSTAAKAATTAEKLRMRTMRITQLLLLINYDDHLLQAANRRGNATANDRCTATVSEQRPTRRNSLMEKYEDRRSTDGNMTTTD